MLLSLRAALGVSAMLLLPCAATFDLSQGGALPLIVHEDQPSARLAADMPGSDLQALSGLAHRESSSLDDCTRRCVVIGTAASALVQRAARLGKVDPAPLTKQRERYVRTAFRANDGSGREILLIAGSDRRGAVYGAVDLTRELGVSPW